MRAPAEPMPILIADDDVEDRMLAKEALEQCRLANPLVFVNDGEELMDYLLQQGRYAEPGVARRPGLILLDLKMPKKDGFEALAEIKRDARLRQIPVVVMTTSSATDDIFRSYDLGVNSFITKPITFVGLVDAMKILGRYWFELVEVSDHSTGG